MTKHLLIAVAVTLSAFSAEAQTVKEKKARANVDEKFAESTARVKDCGKTFKFVYDWKAFEAADFKKAGREKMDQLGSEPVSIEGFGDAINTLCADKDYKEALQKISTIVYKPTGNSDITVKASVKGDTLTFENYMFGSSRAASDYEYAAKEAL
jgi:hypothetical protein